MSDWNERVLIARKLLLKRKEQIRDDLLNCSSLSVLYYINTKYCCYMIAKVWKSAPLWRGVRALSVSAKPTLFEQIADKTIPSDLLFEDDVVCRVHWIQY